jgi:membrane-associated phospholipid phosphatase
VAAIAVAAVVADASLARAQDRPVEEKPAGGKTAGERPPGPDSPRRRGVNDQRRTVRSYGYNLVHNTIAVPRSAYNLRPLVITTAFALPAYAWDDEVVGYFERHPHQGFGDTGAALGGGLAIGGVAVGFFAAGRVARGDRFRAVTYDASQAIIINELYTTGVKLAVKRERPDHSNRLSFPSGHASNAFAIASVVGHHYGRGGDVAAYTVASFIALSRCAANKHHFSDVVAGAGLGWTVGHTVSHRNARPPGTADAGRPGVQVTVAPAGGPSGDGRGFQLHVAF